MKLMKFAMTAVIVQGLTLQAFAQNRDASDNAFNEPKGTESAQVFIGLAETIAAAAINPSLSVKQAAIEKAEDNLHAANRLPTNEVERKAFIKDIMENRYSYQYSGGMVDSIPNTRIGDGRPGLTPKALKKVEAIENSRLLKLWEKKYAVERAESKLSDVRASFIKSAQSLGLIDNALRVARVGTSLVLLSDVAARVYVWNKLDASPTISPAATYILNEMKK